MTYLLTLLYPLKGLPDLGCQGSVSVDFDLS